MNWWTILLAILVFSLMILMHEFGHFITARMFKVAVEEFSIGMGPKIFSYQGKKTLFSIRAFPLGGFCRLKGEEERDGQDDSFTSKSPWKRVVVLCAGAAMNLLFGILIMAVIVSTSPVLVSTSVAQFNENSTSNTEGGLMVDDQILKVGFHRTFTYSEIFYFITKNGTEPIDVTVMRDGEKKVLSDVEFATKDSDGTVIAIMDFKFYAKEKTLGNVLLHSVTESFSNMRMIWDSFIELFTGRYDITELSGPIGVTDAIGKAANDGIRSLLYMVSFISMNLGIFNLLPFPALDGGRLVFIGIEVIRKKPVKPEIEGYVNLVGLAILFILMIIVAVNDIIKIF